MSVKRFSYGIVAVICVGALLCSGCSRRGRGTGIGDVPGVGTDTINPAGVGADAQLSPRFADGERISEVSFQNVQFAYDSFRIEESETARIEAVFDYMQRNANVRLVAEGHCDERGSREYNMSLGEHRALAVRAYLVGLGVSGARIQTRSFGEEKPLDSSHTESAWRLNRRVEFALYR
jgi:peptidoglycan-associated lipoprotein